MISDRITPSRIPGLARLFQSVPRDFSFESMFLKGVLLHDSGELQLTYTMHAERTFIIAFRMAQYETDCAIHIPADRRLIGGIDIDMWGERQEKLVLEDRSNDIRIVCSDMTISTVEILGKAYGEEQGEILTRRYAETMMQKFRGLKSLRLENGTPLFRHDDSYNGIVADHHVMYKLPSLRSRDGSLEYEFLIEFDRFDPCVGIYYGCKGLIKSGDSASLQRRLDEEWEHHIKPRVCERLSALFPEKCFSNRFKPTDNANDNTYWPFWISLYEDENMQEVAVRALIIIRDQYKRHLECKDGYAPDDVCRYVVKDIRKEAGEVRTVSRYTIESYETLLHPWQAQDEKWNNQWAALLSQFIEGALQNGYLTDNVDGHEKAFQLKCKTVEFAVCMQYLLCMIDNRQLDVPWTALSNQFISKSGKEISDATLKNSCGSKYWEERLSRSKDQDAARWIDIARREMIKSSPKCQILPVFRKIMGE